MSNYKIICGRKISPRCLLQISKLENETYEAKYHMNIFKSIMWVIKSCPGYVAVYDKSAKKVIAYVCLLSLKDKYYDMIKNGEVLDVALPIKAQNWFTKNKSHHLYCSSVIIDKDYQNSKVIGILGIALFNNLELLAKKGIYGDKFLADAVSNNGEKLCEVFGLKHCKDTNHNSKIYEVSFNPMEITPLSSSGREVIRLYNEHFNK